MNSFITYGKADSDKFVSNEKYIKVFAGSNGSIMLTVRESLLRQIPVFEKVEADDDIAVRIDMSASRFNTILEYLRTGLMDATSITPVFKYYLNFIGMPELAFPGYINMRGLLKYTPTLQPLELDDCPFLTKCINFTSLEVIDVNNPNNTITTAAGLPIDAEFDRLLKYIESKKDMPAPIKRKYSFTIVDTDGSHLYCFVEMGSRTGLSRSDKSIRFLIDDTDDVGGNNDGANDASTNAASTNSITIAGTVVASGPPKKQSLRSHMRDHIRDPINRFHLDVPEPASPEVFYYIFDDKFNLIGHIHNVDLYEGLAAGKEKIDKIERWTYTSRTRLSEINTV